MTQGYVTHSDLLKFAQFKDTLKKNPENKPVILVVGDLMLDTYLFGKVTRISPEAPVPVHRLNATVHIPGGAANVALNVNALGGKAVLVGVVGASSPATPILTQSLVTQGVDCLGLVSSSSRVTTRKTRVVAGAQQIVRIDDEDESPLSPGEQSELMDALSEAIAAHKPVMAILSDYAKGVLTQESTPLICKLMKEKNIPILVDPKSKSFQKYQGAFGICPNRRELMMALETHPGDASGELIDRIEAMRVQCGFSHVFYTRSEEGLSLVSQGGGHVHWPATAREVVDVSGAGDTVIAVLGVMLASGFSPSESAFLANLAAGIGVQKVGTYAVSLDELHQELRSKNQDHSTHKIFSELHRLKKQVEDWKKQGQKVVFTNGCFDLFHFGHLTLLQECRRLGHRLVVAVNSDSSVKRLKGAARPHVSAQQRIQILSGLEVVDAVIEFSEDTPLNVIKAIEPHVLAKGGDYTADQVVGREVVESYGGEVTIIGLVPGISTTLISKKILAGEH